MTFVVGVSASGAPQHDVERTLRSIVDQTCRDWRVVLVGAGECDTDDPRIGRHAGDAWELARSAAGEDGWVAVVAAGDVLRPNALGAIADVVEHSDVDVVYTDELVRGADDDRLCLKPDWSPERARSHDYCGQLVVFRGSTLAGISAADTRHAVLVRAAGRARAVGHVPQVLFERALAEPVDVPPRRRYPAVCGTASVVIPTAGMTRAVWGVDRPLVLAAVDSVLALTRPTPQVVVVVDPSTPPQVRRALASRDVELVDGDAPFNFAKACNTGVAASHGDHVVLLNDDTLVEDGAWLSVMTSFFSEPDVGAVGARLLYADGTLQHGGVLLNGQPLHIFHGYWGGDHGPFGLLQVNREVSAVTGACLATPRALWDELGGLDQAFAIAGNDLDYCLRLRRAGYRIIWTPDATLYHFESQSRRTDPTPADTSLIYERWGREIHADPYGNPNFEPRQAEWVSRQPLGIEQRIWRGLRRMLGRPEPSDG